MKTTKPSLRVKAKQPLLISGAVLIASAGVNVHIGGAVQIDGQQKFQGACTGALAGTFDTENGCYYYCDGTYRQAFNVAFNEGANPDAQSCENNGRCSFDGIKLRPGDKVMAYKVERAANCETVKKIITCEQAGTFDDTAYPYSYCMPWDSTSTGLINSYHP